MSAAKLVFRGGTLEIYDYPDAPEVETPPAFSLDARMGCLRGPASAYADLILWMRARGLALQDEARRYAVLPLDAARIAQARPYQVEALAAWMAAGSRGVVVLPTGAGKTHVALAAIAQRKRSTLVVAPTLELVRQWSERLQEAFGGPIGVVGGGSHEVQPITVTTYDSAHLHMGHLGARFGCLIFDECHHLPTESYAFAARGAIAPFRLGLTATPERAGDDDPYSALIGPIVFRKDIVELSGTFLASYETVRVPVVLDEAERAEHDAARATFRGFIVKNRIPLGAPNGFQTFLRKASMSNDGRVAMAAYRMQRKLALFGCAKLRTLQGLFEKHAQDRILVFTDDNQAAHRISCEFLVPVLTHRTKLKERLALMADFRSGVLPILVTSKVLNEGVDIPEANVAIVASGSGSVREHVQRLGRVLRAREGKRATLYELVTEDSSDEGRSARRREHSAYR